MLSFFRFPGLGFSLFVSRGETSIEAWLHTVRQYGQEGMTTRELYDLRPQTNLFSNEEIATILQQTVEDRQLRPPNGTTAILVNEAVKYGLSRMFGMQAEVRGVSSVTQVFFELDDALNWLGDDVADCVHRHLDAISS